MQIAGVCYTKGTMGRPTRRQQINRKIGKGVSKQTPETIGKLEAAFAVDCSIREACFYAGINPDTYYTWVKNNPKLSERFEALRNRPVIQARQTIVKALDDPNHAFRFLSHKRPDEFGSKTKVELAGKLETGTTEAAVAVQTVVDQFEKSLRETIASQRKKK